MDILDKLFSRELNRRTGERAIKIDADKKASQKNRAKSLGENALKASNGNVQKEKPKTSLLHRLDVRLPWLKIVAVFFIGLVAILDLLDLTISRVYDPYNKISIAPMSKHVRITERNLEGKKLVALTFDDGPSSETTPTLLKILQGRDVPATFFMLGYMARNNPDLVKQVKKAGHEIASHTMYHQNLIRISAGAVESDINEARTILTDILGQAPSLTRPPYGNINDAVRKNVGTPIILWSVDTLDWKYKNTDSIVSITMSEVSDGAIILMHDIHPTSVEAVPVLIDTLRDAGYEFTTISELAKIRQINLTNGTTYYNLKP
ncbi:polysaccharide deacetylase family protein [Candidatus Saccharibacteria bacterium]|nr:polysaccharide deacetylase family protein [Candidatus Saccharibacteria bacterium]